MLREKLKKKLREKQKMKLRKMLRKRQKRRPSKMFKNKLNRTTKSKVHRNKLKNKLRSMVRKNKAKWNSKRRLQHRLKIAVKRRRKLKKRNLETSRTLIRRLRLGEKSKMLRTLTLSRIQTDLLLSTTRESSSSICNSALSGLSRNSNRHLKSARDSWLANASSFN